MRYMGVDFDHTLCDGAGQPIGPMVNRIKSWRAAEIEVRIITARMSPLDYSEAIISVNERVIRRWCLEHLGEELPVQWGKSSGMICLWDDKVICVEPDTGRIISSGSYTS